MEGDELAFLKLSRLVTSFLRRWRAYDFEDEWPDLVQEVLQALIEAVRERRLKDRRAVVGYVRQVAHHKFVDHLRRRIGNRQGINSSPDGANGAGPEAASSLEDIVVDVRLALERLPERRRKVVFAVYGMGQTYQQVCDETGIPLGTLKDTLRDGMAELRRLFGEEPELR